MRSIAAKILLWSFGTLVFSLIAFVLISFLLIERNVQRGDIFRRLGEMEMEEARYAYESGGPERLAAYLAHLKRYFPKAEHSLTDAAGRDLAIGQDRSELIGNSKSSWRPHIAGGRFIIPMQSRDGRYR